LAGADCSGVRSVPAIGLFGNTLEWIVTTLDLHQLACSLIPFLPMPVGTLELSAASDSALPKPFACVLSHFDPTLSNVRLAQSSISVPATTKQEILPKWT
jgi:hypothetical protein